MIKETGLSTYSLNDLFIVIDIYSIKKLRFILGTVRNALVIYWTY